MTTLFGTLHPRQFRIGEGNALLLAAITSGQPHHHIRKRVNEGEFGRDLAKGYLSEVGIN